MIRRGTCFKRGNHRAGRQAGRHGSVGMESDFMFHLSPRGGAAADAMTISLPPGGRARARRAAVQCSIEQGGGAAAAALGGTFRARSAGRERAALRSSHLPSREWLKRGTTPAACLADCAVGGRVREREADMMFTHSPLPTMMMIMTRPLFLCRARPFANSLTDCGLVLRVMTAEGSRTGWLAGCGGL